MNDSVLAMRSHPSFADAIRKKSIAARDLRQTFPAVGPVWSRSAQRTKEKLPLPGGERVGVRSSSVWAKGPALDSPHPRSLHSLDLSPPGRGEGTEKGSGTPKGADIQPPLLAARRCSCGSSTPLGVPPRFLPKGLLIPKAQLRPGFVGGGAETRRVAPASTAPTSSDAPRAPVIVPAGMMPEPPECADDEPNVRGHRTRSANCSQQPASFTRARFAAACN